jgi:hypothetical protein
MLAAIARKIDSYLVTDMHASTENATSALNLKLKCIYGNLD